MAKPKTSDLKCRHCGKPIRKWTGAINEWWVHEKSRSQTCETGFGEIAQPE
jgi:hypothetical protein